MPASYHERLERMNQIVAVLQSHTIAKQGISTRDLLSRLGTCYEDCSSADAQLRSIQRDLKELQQQGRVKLADGGGKTFRYLPANEKAEVDHYAWDYALRQIGAQLMDVVSSRELEAVLAQLQGEMGGNALDETKLRFIPDAMRLKPATIDPKVLTQVLCALAHDHVLDVAYRDRLGNATKPKLHPQALLQRGPQVYLFALKDEETEVRMYALHRFVKATATSIPARKAETFDLDQSIYNGQADFANGEQITLKALVRRDVATLLYECPLNDSQRLDAEPDGAEFKALLTVNLPASGQLLRWVLGWGEQLKVLEPESLRCTIASQAMKTSLMYG